MVKVTGMLVAPATFAAMPAVAFAGSSTGEGATASNG
jgi:hypothetical protein